MPTVDERLAIIRQLNLVYDQLTERLDGFTALPPGRPRAQKVAELRKKRDEVKVAARRLHDEGFSAAADLAGAVAALEGLNERLSQLGGRLDQVEESLALTAKVIGIVAQVAAFVL